MNTTFVGIKDFRQDISGYARKARGAKTRFVVVNRNTPLFELTPFGEGETMSSLFNAIHAAKEDVRKGRVYTQEQILAEFT